MGRRWIWLMMLGGVLIGGCEPLVSTSSHRVPDVRGRVLAIQPGAEQYMTLLVEYRAGGSLSQDSVRVTAATQLLIRRGNAASQSAQLADLQVGQTVDLWYNGPVALSYPRQATASIGVIVVPDS